MEVCTLACDAPHMLEKTSLSDAIIQSSSNDIHHILNAGIVAQRATRIVAHNVLGNKVMSVKDATNLLRNMCACPEASWRCLKQICYMHCGYPPDTMFSPVCDMLRAAASYSHNMFDTSVVTLFPGIKTYDLSSGHDLLLLRTFGMCNNVVYNPSVGGTFYTNTVPKFVYDVIISMGGLPQYIDTSINAREGCFRDRIYGISDYHDMLYAESSALVDMFNYDTRSREFLINYITSTDIDSAMNILCRASRIHHYELLVDIARTMVFTDSQLRSVTDGEFVYDEMCPIDINAKAQRLLFNSIPLLLGYD